VAEIWLPRGMPLSGCQTAILSNVNWVNEMINKLKALAVAAVVAVTPLAASATTFLVDDGIYTLDAPGAAPFLGNVDALGGAGDFTVTFSATPTNYGEMELTIGGGFLALFDDLKVGWQTVGGSVLTAIDPIVEGTGILQTTFDVVNSTQKLVFSWTDSVDSTVGGTLEGRGFDFEVSPVPVPAAGFLLIGALGALGVARRRKS